MSMTGWRMGYLACSDAKLVKMMANLQSQCTSNINSITQKASIIALSGVLDSEIESMRDAFLQRRNIAYEMINKIRGLNVLKPQGAFYLFINIQKLPRFNGDSMEFCKQILQDKGIAFVPGSAFGMDGYVRMSFACSKERIVQGIERVKDFINGL